MSILNRYLFRRNLFLLAIMLLTGVGVFILTDLLQRIDNFMEAEYGLGQVVFFFLIRMPMIISQILPAVFLLSLVLQFLLMHKNSENIALQSGGVSPLALLRFVLVYGLIMSCVQFVFAQGLGIPGERMAADIWQKEVQRRDLKQALKTYAIQGLLFTHGNYVVRAEYVWPYREEAENVRVYELSPDGSSILAIHAAKQARSSSSGWTLLEVETITPPDFGHKNFSLLALDIRQDLESFKNFLRYTKNSVMEIGDLRNTIKRLEQAGANMEAMRINYYGRFAYAASILVMGLLALSVSAYTENIYLGVLFSLLCVFLFFTLNTYLNTMGEIGAIPPLMAAWGGNGIFMAISGGYIFLRQGIRRNRALPA
jgi:lipopolysaccharide export system permease protein